MSARARLEKYGPPAFLVLLAFFPILGAIAHPDRFVGDELGELPVKLWVLETFARIGLVVGRVETAGFPAVGPLNNPDAIGALLTEFIRPVFGRVWAWNLLMVVQVGASMLTAWALAKALVGDAVAAIIGGVAFGLTPIVLAYAVTGAVSDILNLWPYPLAILFTFRALQADTLRGATWRALVAGAMAGMGFVTCPYNFVVFAGMAFPGLALLPYAHKDGVVPTGTPIKLRWRPTLIVGLAIVVGIVVVAGTDALVIHTMMADPKSQMSAAAVAATRHSPPFRSLQPGWPDRYVAYLADYIAVGKGTLIQRVAASRFYRAFSPGLSVLALTCFALTVSRRWRTIVFWVGMAFFCILASTGPFLPITRGIYIPSAVNPTWLMVQYLLPGGTMILEPFRYALPAALSLGICASIGTVELMRRYGRWVGVAVPLVFLFELVVISPVPFPLPTTRFDVPDVYRHLDSYLGPGAIIELPYFDRATERFNRVHFLFQLIHGRPIADEVLGFAPRYLHDNQYTARLLATEKNAGPLKVEVTDPSRVDPDRMRLRDDGFAGIIVDPSAFVSDTVRDAVLAQLAELSRPIAVGERIVYRVP